MQSPQLHALIVKSPLYVPLYVPNSEEGTEEEDEGDQASRNTSPHQTLPRQGRKFDEKTPEEIEIETCFSRALAFFTSTVILLVLCFISISFLLPQHADRRVLS